MLLLAFVLCDMGPDLHTQASCELLQERTFQDYNQSHVGNQDLGPDLIACHPS